MQKKCKTTLRNETEMELKNEYDNKTDKIRTNNRNGYDQQHVRRYMNNNVHRNT